MFSVISFGLTISSGVSAQKTVERRVYLSGRSPAKLIEFVLGGQTIKVSTKTVNQNQSLVEFSTTSKEYLGDVSVHVTHLGRNTNKVPRTPNAYSYTEIDLKHVKDDEIKNSEITFRVDKSWLEEMDAEAEDVIAKRYQDEWKPLETEYVEEKNDYHRFRGQSPGFSVFAITVKPRIHTTKEADQEIKNQVYQNLMNQDFNKIVLGKAGATEIDATFKTNTMTYNGKTYESTWKKEDYALIQFKNNKVYIVGTHRYGTKAAIQYYKQNKPTQTTLIKWKDQNNDQKPQKNEIQPLN